MRKTNAVPVKRREQFRALYVGCDVNAVYRSFCRKRAVLASAAGLVFLLMGAGAVLHPARGMLRGDGTVKRPGYGKGDRELEVLAGIQEGNREIKEERRIIIKEQRYGEREWEQAAAAARDYIDRTVRGENETLDYVTKPLYLAEEIPETALQLSWDRGDGIIGPGGEITAADLPDAGRLINITAIISCDGREARYPVFMRLFPPELTERERLDARLDGALLRAQEETETEPAYPLPEEDGEVRFTYEEKQNSGAGALLLLGILAAAAAGLSAGRNLDQRMKRRERQLLMDYPAVIHKFSLLIGAGMTLKKAWQSITEEYLEQKKKGMTGIRYVYEEMAVTMRELENGASEGQAFAGFGKRIRLLPYQKWVSLLQQNLKKGTRGLMDALELEALEAGEERRKLARQAGEEAGTRLLLPMGMMLFIVLAIIIVPAFQTF